MTTTRTRRADLFEGYAGLPGAFDELFDAEGGSTPDRERMLDAIRGMNQQVMSWRPGVEGVTRPYVVPAGKAPVQIVSDEKLRLGHNAILLWNKRGSLDPRRLVAGETLLLPLGELTLEVSLERRRLVVWLDDAFVKEFRVGVGKPSTPNALARPAMSMPSAQSSTNA